MRQGLVFQRLPRPKITLTLPFQNHKFDGPPDNLLNPAFEKPLLRPLILDMGIPSSRISPVQATFAYWDLLPRELRLLILSKTPLVRRHDWMWNKSASPAGPNIENGRFLLPELDQHKRITTCDRAHATESSGPCNTCLARREMPFPFALFMVKKQMYEDAGEVFWSQRFVLRGNLFASAIWLSNLNENCARKIKKMHLVIPNAWSIVFPNPGKSGRDRVRDSGLQCLIETIQLKCNPGKLWLSIDVEWSESFSCVWDDTDHLRGEQGQDYRKNLQSASDVLFMPMVESFQGDYRLARLHVFLSWDPEGEAATERAVMGERYDSALEGKVAFNDRDVRDPHRRRSEDDAAEYLPMTTGW